MCGEPVKRLASQHFQPRAESFDASHLKRPID